MASLMQGEDDNPGLPGDVTHFHISEREQQEEADNHDQDNFSPEKSVRSVLEHRQLEGDLMWSLFVAASRSYRFSSVLHPFPPMYCGEDREEKHVYALRDAISRMPSFSSCDLHQIPEDCHQLLTWVFQKPKFQLKKENKDKCFEKIRGLTGQVMSAPEPTYVFEVIHDRAEEEKFQARQGSRESIYAYHGSRFDNFYSIMHNGLNVHLNKVSVFGEGTYLSSELTVSLMYSQAGEAWSASSLGARLACVAVCEMIDDPSVKCQVKNAPKNRAQASKLADAVPEKYYVVQNNDMIRVKYLLIYKDESAPTLAPTNSTSLDWMRRHKFPLLMLAYIMLLLAIGLANSRQASQAFRRFLAQFKLS